MTQHLTTEPATAAVCARCGARVIAAVVDGLTTIADIQPLTIDEEIAALLTGHATFDLQPNGNRVYLEWRDITRIRAGRNYPVVAAHGCTHAGYHRLPPVQSAELPDDPPF